MNRLAVSISILAFMAVGCTVSVVAADSTASKMSQLVEQTEKAYTDGDKYACVSAARQLSDTWSSVLKYNILINDLGHALEITSSIAEIESFAQEQNEELYAACDRAQAQIKLFRDMQIPTFWKII
ncbi:MAG: DUF4363 family protein [Oscillospiraceae bacterium]